MKLGDVLEKIIGGGTPSKNNDEFWNGNIPWASVKDINEGQVFLSSTEDTVTEEGVKNSSTNIISKGTVIIPTRMGLGRCVISTIDTAINQDLKALYPQKDKLDNKFLLYWLKNNSRLIESMGSGTTVKGLRIEQLTDINFKELDLYIQQKIAKILSNYDDLIENNNKRIKILEEMAQKIYKEWFVRFHFPGHKTAKFVDGIPEGWKVKNYSDEINIKYGKGLPTDQLLTEGYPVFGSNGIIGFYSKYMYENPQILISCRGASSGVVNISLPYSFVTSNSLICEMNDKYTESTFEYLKYYFLSANLVQYQTGAAQPQITIDNIKNLKIVVPSVDIQRKFSSLIIPIDKELLSLTKLNDNLRKTRNLLLPRLMSGEINVDKLEIA